MLDDRAPFPLSLEERYKNPRFIGAGGASTVYAALDSNLNKEVAIKILGPRASGQKLVRFQQEAKVISKLAHPHIVTAIDFGIVDENFAYMVMDLVGEESLHSLIEKRDKLSVKKCIDIFKQVSIAMAHAHSLGVLHRDLKPGNVLLDDPRSDSPKAKVADFGVAKIAGTPFFVTTGNIFIGTPNYMSPEQFRAEDVDQRSDIYSFGCLMFETLTGNLPFPGDVSTELAFKHENSPIPPLPCTAYGEEIPPALQDVVRQCLAKKPDQRYSSFAELEEDLNAVDQEQLHVASQLASDKKGLAPREPYLVSTATAQFPASDTNATRRILTIIITMVVGIAGLICVSLMDWGPGLGWLFPEAKDKHESTGQPANPINLGQDKAEDKVLAEAVRTDNLDEQKAWRLTETKLPDSMLEGTPDQLIEKAKKQLEERKRPGLAISYLNKALELDPRSYKAFRLRSDARRAKRDFRGALTDITASIQLKPNDKRLLFKRAVLRKEIYDFNSSLDDFTVLVKEFPADGRYWRERGDVQRALGLNDDAFSDYCRSIEIKPTSHALRERGKLYQKRGQFEQAINDYTAAIEMDPKSADLHFLRGNSFNHIKQYQKAIEDYSKAIELRGGNAEFYKMRAAAFERTGQLEKAKQDRAVVIDDFQIK